jgi:hypothetical protein
MLLRMMTCTRGLGLGMYEVEQAPVVSASEMTTTDLQIGWDRNAILCSTFMARRYHAWRGRITLPA